MLRIVLVYGLSPSTHSAFSIEAERQGLPILWDAQKC